LEYKYILKWIVIGGDWYYSNTAGTYSDFLEALNIEKDNHKEFLGSIIIENDGNIHNILIRIPDTQSYTLMIKESIHDTPMIKWYQEKRLNQSINNIIKGRIKRNLIWLMIRALEWLTGNKIIHAEGVEG
jgi:hypothetical protein